MSTLTITRGLPGAGKTSWAKTWVAFDPEKRARINRDDLRRAMFDHGKNYGALSFQQEEAVTLAQQASVRALLDRGVDVVADDMNLRPKYVRAWREFAETVGHEFRIEAFEETVESCVMHDAWRLESVGPRVISELARKYLHHGKFLDASPIERPEVEGAKYKADQTKPKAFIVDIDGTLALNTSGRGWYDLERVCEDEPNVVICDLVDDAAGGWLGRPIYCSGRDERSREVTEAWLRDCALPNGPLFMRPAHDNRQDAIVKRELFDKHIRENYNVQFVLDDRDSVVRMWRSLGLTCLQVADGNF